MTYPSSILKRVTTKESVDEAAESAKNANMLLTVSEFENIEDATEALISLKQAYQELTEVNIIDILNKIGDNFAISTEGVATALQESASALKTAGNDMYESSALAAAGNTIVQNPDKVGAGLRTIALRLTGTKDANAELAEIGEETDNMITTQSKLRETIMNATRVASNNNKGIDIFDDNGK